MNKKSNKVPQVSWLDGFGTFVPGSVSITRTQDCARVRVFTSPVNQDGETFTHQAELVTTDMDTQQESYRMTKLAKSLAEALQVRDQYVVLMAQERKPYDNAVAADKKRRENLSKPVNCDCEGLTSLDFIDVEAARQIVLQRAYPNLFAANESAAKAEDIAKAFLLDVAAATGKAFDKNMVADAADDPTFLVRLGKAIEKSKTASHKSTLVSLAIAEIARGWIVERYCDMLPGELAEKINKTIGVNCNFTGANIKKLRGRMLRLMSKRKDGRSGFSIP